MKDNFDKMFEPLKKDKLDPKTEEAEFRIVITDVKNGQTLHDFKSDCFAAVFTMNGKAVSIAQSHGCNADVLSVLLGLRKIQAAIEKEVPKELLALLPLAELMNNDHD